MRHCLRLREAVVSLDLHLHLHLHLHLARAGPDPCLYPTPFLMLMLRFFLEPDLPPVFSLIHALHLTTPVIARLSLTHKLTR